MSGTPWCWVPLIEYQIRDKDITLETLNVLVEIGDAVQPVLSAGLAAALFAGMFWLIRS